MATKFIAKNGSLFKTADGLAQINLQDKTVTPTASGFTVSQDSGYSALNSVVVNGDENLVAENIKNGVEVFGVTGTLSGGGATVISGSITPAAQSSSLVISNINAEPQSFSFRCNQIVQSTFVGSSTNMLLANGCSSYSYVYQNNTRYSAMAKKGSNVTTPANAGTYGSTDFTVTYNSSTKTLTFTAAVSNLFFAIATYYYQITY